MHNRVKVFNPESMESIARFAESHMATLEDIADGVNSSEEQARMQRATNAVTLDANGQGLIEFDGQIGYDRICERISTCVTGATVGNVAIFFATTAPLNLIEFISMNAQTAVTVYPIGACICYSDAFNNSIHLVTADKLLVQFSGYAAGAVAAVNIQEKYMKQYEHTHKMRRVNSGMA